MERKALAAAARHPDREADLLLHRVGGLLGDRDRPAVAHAQRHLRRRVDQRGDPVVGRGEPEVLREFRPSLVHVRIAAGESRERAEDHVGLRVHGIFVEIARVTRRHHLIGLLEILLVHEVVGHLRRQGVEGDPFEAVGESHVARYAHHLFEREHHLDRGAQLRALRRIAAVQPLVGAVHPLRLTVEQRQIRESLLHGVEIAPLAGLLIEFQ